MPLMVAIDGRAALGRAGISPGAFKPFEILVQGASSDRTVRAVVPAVASTPGVTGATAPVAWRRPGTMIVEAIPNADGAAKSVRGVISNLQQNVLPSVAADTGTRVDLGGIAPEDRDFVHAVYGNSELEDEDEDHGLQRQDQRPEGARQQQEGEQHDEEEDVRGSPSTTRRGTRRSSADPERSA